MTLEKTYDTIAHWLNSCVSDEQIDLCVDVARSFLRDRHNAHEQYYILVNIAELKKSVPTMLAPSWETLTR